MKPSIYAFSQANLVDWILENGEKKFRATQIWEWLYRSRVQSFAEMTNLPKSLIEKLEEHFVVNPRSNNGLYRSLRTVLSNTFLNCQMAC